MITEDYVSFEIAKLLKEKGFLKEIDLRITQNLSFYDNIGLTYNLNKWYDSLIQDKIDFVVAPTHQMTMKWLREVHKLHIQIWILEEKGYWFDIEKILSAQYKHKSLCSTGLEDIFFKTCEQATEAAIKYCLENLI